MVGVGGQGIILSSNILSLAAMREGNDVKKSEIHGMSQRGGSVFSHIRFGEKVYSPVIPAGEVDILLSLEALETLRWAEYTSENTNVIYMKDHILPAGLETYPEGVEDEISKVFKNVKSIDPKDLKGKLENVKSTNVALLGMLSKHIPIKQASWEYAIEKCVPKGTFDVNLAAFETGKNL